MRVGQRIALFGFLCLFSLQSNGQNSIVLNVIGGGETLPFASVEIAALELQEVCDNNGQLVINDIDFKRSYDLSIRYLGYQPLDTTFVVGKRDTEITFDLQEIPFELSEMVVSGTRTNKRRLESAVAVHVIDGQTFEMTNSGTLAEGMCFQPGLRVETDCQTCNYTQLRMNGLAGSYTQVLIDSRPIFSSIMSLYSLEQIPASQIERVEVVRGGPYSEVFVPYSLS